jgi:NADH-quinone oxidoreductase subunit L
MDEFIALIPWLILFLPLGAAAVIGLFVQQDRRLSAKLSIGAVGVGFGLTLLFIGLAGLDPVKKEAVANWLEVGALQVDFGLRLDPLSLLMLLVVTGVGLMIHIYSQGYMHEDRGFGRFFACLSLFMFSMLGIVLANNFLQLFIFWELVGVSSYLLIGFWYEKDSAADACKKAFLTNRLGDFGFLLGILMVWATFGSLNFSVVQDELAKDPSKLAVFGTLGGLLIFCGAVGKSAQFPLHVWLPDAMEGPTPVSALIHAATMVAAGVYMLCRVAFVFTPDALLVIAWVGGLTALLAALMAVQQNDIKRILAYSTLSQLGYMVMAVGLAAAPAAMYHLSTHAFFKALLFLGAGSVIHALHHEQDIWKMGGLRETMPTTYRTFWIGTLALCGVPLFSGFYSKDAILAAAAHQGGLTGGVLFGLGVIVAVLTTFYMFRLVFVAFRGRPRTDAADHADESPHVMTVPLMVLAFFSIVAGFMGIEGKFAGLFPSYALHESHGFADAILGPFAHAPLPAFFGLLAVVAGYTFARALYLDAPHDPLPDKIGFVARWMRDKFYFDELYAKLIAVTQDALATVADWFDRWIIAGLGVRGAHGTTELFGRALRLVQTGNLQTYAFLFAAGVAVVLFLALK